MLSTTHTSIIPSCEGAVSESQLLLLLGLIADDRPSKRLQGLQALCQRRMRVVVRRVQPVDPDSR